MKYYFGKTKLDFSSLKYTLSGFDRRDVTQQVIGKFELFVKILWIQLDNKQMLFISLDILYIPKELSEKVYQYLQRKYNIEKTNIIFNATHTHSAPGIEKKFDSFVDDRIIEHIFEEICVICDRSNFKYGKISFKTIKSKSNMWISRRKFGKNIKKLFLKESMLMLPNKKNEIDDSIRLISIINEKNEIDVLIYNFSCHPVFNKSNKISSDFVGEISQQLEKESSIKNTMFLQGFLGDIRPNFTTNNMKKVNMVDKLKILVNKEIFKKYDKKDFEIFCTNITNEILDNLPYNSTKERNYIYQDEFFYKIQSQSERYIIEFSVKVACVDKNIFVSIPAEVNSKYYVMLSKKFSKSNIIPMGLADNIIGYLPFHDEVNEGGYEVNSIVNYGFDTPFSEISLKRFYFFLQSDIKKMIGKVKDDY